MSGETKNDLSSEMEIGTVIIIAAFTGVVSGIACAAIADEKGLNGGGWFALGFS